ncbi:hypothetical protein CP991_29670, partial [Escherichia coli]
ATSAAVSKTSRTDQCGLVFACVTEEAIERRYAVVRLAEAAYEKYGFNDFKLKGHIRCRIKDQPD